METDLDEKLDLDFEKIKNAVRLQLPIEITTYSLPRNMEIYIRKVLELFLKECHQEHMFEYLNFCLGELLTNAKKANTKRIYFKEKNLDINNPDDYKVGMENFKEDTLQNINHYLIEQKKEGLYIKLILQMKGEKIRVDIKNNVKITTFELERIKNKIENVQTYHSIEDVFMNVLDQSEGAGLGILIIILMLQKIGLSKENYQVIATEDETITRIVLPCNLKIFAGTEILTYEFVKLQESIPVLKDRIEQVKEIVSHSPINKDELINIIKDDSTLALLLIKNTIKKDSSNINLKHIMKLLSDDEIKEIFNPEDQQIKLIESTPEKQELWNHSKNVALYAYNFAKNYPELQQTLSPEEAYSLGLFSNLGYLFLENSSTQQKEYIQELCSEFEENQKVSDIFFLGNTSPFISMMYTKKIGVIDTFSAILGCWNNSDIYPQPIKDAAEIIYIAELMQFYDEKIIEYYQIDKAVLSKFNINSESQFKYILGELKQ